MVDMIFFLQAFKFKPTNIQYFKIIINCHPRIGYTFLSAEKISSWQNRPNQVPTLISFLERSTGPNCPSFYQKKCPSSLECFFFYLGDLFETTGVTGGGNYLFIETTGVTGGDYLLIETTGITGGDYLLIETTGVAGGELVLPADEEVAGGGVAGPLVAPLGYRGIPDIS